MLVNGYDFKNLCFLLNRTSVVGQADPGVISRLIPGQPKSIFVGRRGTEVRTIVVNAAIGTHGIGLTRTQLQGILDTIKARLARGAVTLVFSDFPTRQITAYGHVEVDTEIDPNWVQEVIPFRMVFICPDPRWRETSQTVNSNNLTQTAVAGTAKMPIIISLNGNATPTTGISIAYKNSAGATVATIGYTGSVSNSETLLIDTEFFFASKNGSSVMSAITGDFFDVDPKDYVYETSSWTTVVLTHTGGVPINFHIEYYKRWH